MKRRMAVIGVGNALLMDEGVGIHVVNLLKQLKLPCDVDVHDCAVDGFRILDLMESYEKVVIIDAVQRGGKPGTIYRFGINELELRGDVFNMTSLHDMDLTTALEAGKAIGKKLDNVVVIGVEIKEVNDALELSPEIEEVIPDIVGLIREEITQIRDTLSFHSKNSGTSESSMNRRNFIKIATGAIALLPLSLDFPNTNSDSNLSKYAALIDISKCTGCRACYVACKTWNKLPVEEERKKIKPPSHNLSSRTWTDVEPVFVSQSKHFVKWQCMHCQDPACVSSCTVGAMHKTKDGAVVIDDEKCVGCRYCMIACPFSIPKFEWEKPRSVVRKCTFCYDRIATGLEPACARACPTGAIKFGDRNGLLEMAKLRIENGNYVKHIYGENEVGGTSFLYLSDVPFEKLGFPKVGIEAPPEITVKNWYGGVPSLIMMGVTLLGSLWLYSKRRKDVEAEEREA